MRHSRIRTTLLIATVAGLLAVSSVPGSAQTTDNSASAQPAAATSASAQGAGPAQPPQICGNAAYCYETNDFAATITGFRITTDVYKRQILDLSVRFQNKTNQQLVLGYVSGSGNASDDRGNRLVPYGPNASRGLGLVYGATFDPKFAVRPAGFGDAQFEFYPQGSPQVVGFTYTLDLSVAEINTFEGNQHTLGEEFPLHFQGLRNGSAGISPGFVPGAGFGQGAGYTNAMSNPCGTAGSLSQGAGQVAGQAASTVSNAATAISSLGSMFHHKKTQDAGQTAANAVPCDPNAGAGMSTPSVVTTNAAGSAATPATTKPVQQAVSRTAVPATTNPLNPLASKTTTPPASTTQASASKPAATTAANKQVAGTAQGSAAAAPATKPAAKPAAKPEKPQPQKRQQTVPQS